MGEIVGDDIIVIVTPNDQLCERCASLLNRLDKSENDVNVIRNVLVSHIQKKYGILPPGHVVESVEVRIVPA